MLMLKMFLKNGHVPMAKFALTVIMKGTFTNENKCAENKVKH